MALTPNHVELQPNNPHTDTSIQACIPLYGVYDLMVRYDQHLNGKALRNLISTRVLHETPEQSPELWEQASPIAQINVDSPPFMVLHGTLDSLLSPNCGRVFSQKLREVSRNPVVWAEIQGAEHGWDMFHSPRAEHTIDGIHRFLEWVRANQ